MNCVYYFFGVYSLTWAAFAPATRQRLAIIPPFVSKLLGIENPMKRYKLFGQSGLRVSELCLGTLTFG